MRKIISLTLLAKQIAAWLDCCRKLGNFKMNQLPKAIQNPEIKYTKLFINNEWVDSTDGSTLSVENPATGKEICKIAEAKKADVDAAVAAAKEAFKLGSPWRKTTPAKRGVLMNKLADLVEKDLNYITSLESLNGGKVYAHTFAEMISAVDTLRYFAGWCDKDHGKTIPWDDEHFAYTRHEPIGVCGAIIPWNYPLVLCAWKIAPCLATGNVLVLKPSELTPLTALYLGALVKEAGFPPGVLNIIPGYGGTAGSALSHHMEVSKLGFTGSTAVGRLIQKASADSNLKKVTLELGGKSPAIVFADANLDLAVEVAHIGIFYNSGQTCCAGSRTFVEDKIYDEFVKKSVAKASGKKIGNPLDCKTELGPQISKLQKDKILGMIKKGQEQGCKIQCGGEAVEGEEGHFIQPTVLTDLTDDMEISQQEVFGPVQQIYRFKDISEVIDRANNTLYGLAAAVITNDINKAINISNSMEAGTVWVNTLLDGNSATPFGGYKLSGIGRDKGEEALREYTQVKTVIVRVQPSRL